jgi:hypothetical protein
MAAMTLHTRHGEEKQQRQIVLLFVSCELLLRENGMCVIVGIGKIQHRKIGPIARRVLATMPWLVPTNSEKSPTRRTKDPLLIYPRPPIVTPSNQTIRLTAMQGEQAIVSCGTTKGVSASNPIPCLPSIKSHPVFFSRSKCVFTEIGVLTDMIGRWNFSKR